MIDPWGPKMRKVLDVWQWLCDMGWRVRDRFWAIVDKIRGRP